MVSSAISRFIGFSYSLLAFTVDISLLAILYLYDLAEQALSCYWSTGTTFSHAYDKADLVVWLKLKANKELLFVDVM